MASPLVLHTYFISISGELPLAYKYIGQLYSYDHVP